VAFFLRAHRWRRAENGRRKSFFTITEVITMPTRSTLLPKS
jgi:hypothetical protein